MVRRAVPLSARRAVAEETDERGGRPARCLRIIPCDTLRTKRADLQISTSHRNDPEMTQWPVSGRQTRDLGWWMDVTAEVNADEAQRDPTSSGEL